MNTLPDSVMELRNKANICSDELHDAWNKLNEIEIPTMQDLDQWLEVRNHFFSAQKEFEERLTNFLNSGLHV